MLTLHGPPSLHRSALALCLALAAVALGCSDDTAGFADAAVFDSTTDASGRDARAPTDAEPLPDVLGMYCTRSSQCDDGVECTRDFCADNNRCVSVTDDTSCDDRVFCNGVERCDARRGCVRGEPRTCSDNSACTIDRCDEATQSCTNAPRDFDRDGDPDGRCASPTCDAGVPTVDGGQCWTGGDCDDNDPRINSRLPEICGDGVDNNCNGRVDDAEPGGCTRPGHDRCDDPLDVSAGGRFLVPAAGAAGDYPTRCLGGGIPQRDVVARFVLASPMDVSVIASTMGTVVYTQVARASCGGMDLGAVLDCVGGFPSTWRARALPAGEYFITLALSGPLTGTGDIDLQVAFTPPSPPPMNQTCATALEIPSTGGSVVGDTVGVTDDVSTTCGGTTPDVLYRITLPETSDLSLRLAGGRSDYMQLSLLDDCMRMPSSIRCESGAPAQFNARRLRAGTYYIAVEGRNVASFTLDAEVLPPSDPPAGDRCDNPIFIAVNSSASGTLSNTDSDHNVSCGSGNFRDIVYRFTLESRSDVTALVRGGVSDFYYLAVESRCGDMSSESACRYGNVGRLTARGLDPGQYFLIIRAVRGTDFDLALDARPSVAPTPVMANDACETAAMIPSGGGFYTGTTAGLRRDYTAPCISGASSEDAVFRYRANERQRVLVSTEGSSFNTVAWMTTADRCPGSNLPGACNDDAIVSASAFDVVVDPGDYYLFVAGINSTEGGAYTLTVTTSSP
ncbi:MAG: putative metal-binding motif-containing protein [Polyangiales bacterium]